MKYLIPAMGVFLVAMLFKNPSYMKAHAPALETLVLHLIDTDFRMEPIAIHLASAMFEKFQLYNGEFLHNLLFAVFKSLHFYRNNTKQQCIPLTIIKAVQLFFANFIIANGTHALTQACNKIQPGILYMILTSEGDKVKHLGSGGQLRDKKYAIVAYAKFIVDSLQDIPENVIKTLLSALIDLACSDI
mmetsp:Transcript_31763/g.31040  ORF Transcript_31763/g.31040 Transcript_31763/m.31040 type:complete len:188 (-) Transcript_31763:338-901(-)